MGSDTRYPFIVSDPTIGQRVSQWPDQTPVAGTVPGSLRYTAESDGQRFMINVLPDACVDDMSGDRFTHTVLLQIDSQRRRGCGREIAP
jgi:uncharacterized membrane protein